jgi:hypothetical protein
MLGILIAGALTVAGAYFTFRSVPTSGRAAPHVTVTVEVPGPRVTVTVRPRATVTARLAPTVTARPHPTVTVTQTVAGGSSGSMFTRLAAVGTFVAGIGTLGFGVAAILALRRRAG